jgi:hypothetical protein
MGRSGESEFCGVEISDYTIKISVRFLPEILHNVSFIFCKCRGKESRMSYDYFVDVWLLSIILNEVE